MNVPFWVFIVGLILAALIGWHKRGQASLDINKAIKAVEVELTCIILRGDEDEYAQFPFRFSPPIVPYKFEDKPAIRKIESKVTAVDK